MNDKKLGFLPEPTQDDHFVYGSGKLTERLGATVLMKNGKGWEKYLPKEEDQRNTYVEPMDCTIAGALNCWEGVANALKAKGIIKDEHFPRNCSERYSASFAGISPAGGSPHRSAEAIRTYKVINESILPLDEKIRTWDEFYSPRPMPEEFKKLARETTKWVKLGQEWLWNDESDLPKKTPEQKAKLIGKALERGLVGVSVHAWKENGGLYYKDPDDQDCHWTVIYEQDVYDKCFDTYKPYKKRIRPLTDYYCAKLYTMAPKTKEEVEAEEAQMKGILSQLLEKLKELFKLLMPSQDHITEIPLSEKYPEPLMPSKSDKLYDIAYSCIGIDMAPLNDAFGCAEALSHVLMKAGVPDMHHPYVGTADLDRWLRDHLTAVEAPEKGDIAMFPTGTGNGKVRGHCFVVGEHSWMSNNSQSGKWDYHWKGADAIEYYEVFGGIKARYYRWV